MSTITVPSETFLTAQTTICAPTMQLQQCGAAASNVHLAAESSDEYLKIFSTIAAQNFQFPIPFNYSCAGECWHPPMLTNLPPLDTVSRLNRIDPFLTNLRLPLPFGAAETRWPQVPVPADQLEGVRIAPHPVFRPLPLLPPASLILQAAAASANQLSPTSTAPSDTLSSPLSPVSPHAGSAFRTPDFAPRRHSYTAATACSAAGGEKRPRPQEWQDLPAEEDSFLQAAGSRKFSLPFDLNDQLIHQLGEFTLVKRGSISYSESSDCTAHIGQSYSITPIARARASTNPQYPEPCCSPGSLKRQQNRMAAYRYRLRRKFEQQQKFRELAQLVRRNEELKSEVNDIEKEIDYLKHLVCRG